MNTESHLFFKADAQCDAQYSERAPTLTPSGWSASERTSLDRMSASAGPDGAVVVVGNEAAIYFDHDDALATLDPVGFIS